MTKKTTPAKLVVTQKGPVQNSFHDNFALFTQNGSEWVFVPGIRTAKLEFSQDNDILVSVERDVDGDLVKEKYSVDIFSIE